MSGYHSTAGSPVGMLPGDAVVLLMQTDNIGADCCCAIALGFDGIEILELSQVNVEEKSRRSKYLDVTQAVASKLKVVGAYSGSSISEIKGLLPLEWSPRVCVWDGLRCQYRSLIRGWVFLPSH